MTFYTSSASNLAGLSALAFGSSLFFRETKNQIISKSLYSDLFRSRPSQLFMSLFPSSKYLVELWLEIFDLEPQLRSYYLINKIYYKSQEGYLYKLIDSISYVFDSHSYYDLDFKDLISEAIVMTKVEGTSIKFNSRLVAGSLIEILKNKQTYYDKIIDFYEVIKNNHFAKISDLPDNEFIKLSSLDIEKDWKQVNITYTQIPPQKYFAEEIYRDSKTSREYSSLSQNYYTYLGTHIQSPEKYNGYNHINYPEPTITFEDNILNISLINVKKGLYNG